MLLRRTLQAATLALLLVPAVARAQISDADRAAARDLAEQGQDALERQDFATAADRFSRAAQIVHVPTLTLGLARADVGLGKWVAAEELYSRMVREGAPAGSPPVFAQAVADAQRDLDALRPRIPSVVINVSGAGASGAKVTLDGAPVPGALIGVNRPVDPGPHLVRADAPGFAPVETSVTSVERRAETVTLTIDRPASAAELPPPPTTGPLSVPANVRPAPPAEPPLPQPHEGVSPRKTAGFVLIDVGAAGLIMGAVTGGLAIAKHNTLVSKCSMGHCPTSEDGDLKTYHLMAGLADAGVIAGGALAATGVILFVLSPKYAKPRDAWVTPVVGAGYLGVKGSF